MASDDAMRSTLTQTYPIVDLELLLASENPELKVLVMLECVCAK